ncbi:diguanylate cyclase domain-containing protein [Undibacterium arcticum]
MLKKIHQQDTAVIESGEPLEDLESEGFWRQNAQRWYRTNKYPLRDAQGETVGVLDVTRNVTTRKEFELRMKHQALHDPLTGLPNRRYLLEEISDAIDRTRGHHLKLALLFCDLDGFKKTSTTSTVTSSGTNA